MWVSISVAPNTASLYFGQIYLPFPLSCACFCDLWCGFFSACFLSLIFLLIRCFWHSPVLAAPDNPIFFHRQVWPFPFQNGDTRIGSKVEFNFLFLLFHVFIFSPILISSVDFFICWVHVVSFLLKSFDFQVYFLTRVIKTCKCWIQFIELVLLRLPFCSSDQRETVFFFFFSFSIHLITLQCKHVFSFSFHLKIMLE